MPLLIEEHAEAVGQLIDQGMGDTAIAKQLGLSRKTAYRIRRLLAGQPYQRGAKAESADNVPNGTFSIEEEGDTIKYRATSTTPVKTLEELEASCAVDLSKWRVRRWSCKAWTTTMKVGAKGEKKAESIQNYSVSADFERTAPKAIQQAQDAIFDRMAKHAPKYIGLPKLAKAGKGQEGYLGVIAAFDLHLGKLAWKNETGTNYDLKTAERVFKNAIEDMIAQSNGRVIEQWCLPVGNDFYQIDNAKNTTTAGTPQDMDGPYAKMIEVGELAVIWAVELLMQIAPVAILHVPGNHDSLASFHLVRTLQAWFRNTDRVTVDLSPSPRKYLLWHKTLLGLTHGNEEKFTSLPSIMATEKPKEWAASECREWLLGHMHRSRQWQTQSMDTCEGTVIRALRSLSATDSWHHKRAYLSGPSGRAAEVLWYSKSAGYSGHAVVRARDD